MPKVIIVMITEGQQHRCNINYMEAIQAKILLMANEITSSRRLWDDPLPRIPAE